MELIKHKTDREWTEKISARLATAWGVLPLHKREDGSVAILTWNPENFEVLENLKIFLNSPLTPVPCTKKEFDKALSDCYGLGAEAIDELPFEDGSPAELTLSTDNSDASIARFVNSLLQQAHHDRSTDIHIEPFDNDLQVRFRIDGILHPVHVPSALTRFRLLLASRIKLMAQMNIAEKRLPQDGRLRFRVGEEDLDIRVSTIPTIHGESIDLRLLPRTRLILGPQELGMGEKIRAGVVRLIRRPNGIILVTGPTGHGKTTTLYAFLSQINSTDKKIITIEDPIEYRLKGVNQMQAHPKIGLTFAHGLRAVLRQDPDIIMVGEIRDKETADIAIRASLTGHLVFSTLHTNDAVGATTRLIDMGLEPYLVASSLNAVLAQRLVRLACQQCHGQRSECETCRGTGYFGRTALFELLVVNEELRGLILSGAPPSQLRAKARVAGMTTLFEEGMLKVKAGLTTLEEVRRVTDED